MKAKLLVFAFLALLGISYLLTSYPGEFSQSEPPLASCNQTIAAVCATGNTGIDVPTRCTNSEGEIPEDKAKEIEALKQNGSFDCSFYD